MYRQPTTAELERLTDTLTTLTLTDPRNQPAPRVVRYGSSVWALLLVCFPLIVLIIAAVLAAVR